MSADLQNPIFNDETAAREALEAVRWPNGPFCPHCGSAEGQAKVEGKKQTHRPGLYYCNECKGTYTVTVGTVFERSKVPLSKWWLATHLLSSSKKGMSAHQLHRLLGITYKTAWFMAHRIREGMVEENAGPLGSSGKPVEVDETYFGTDPAAEKPKAGPGAKLKIVALVERGGKARSLHVGRLDGETVRSILLSQVSPNAALMSDGSMLYHGMNQWFSSHDTVNHTAKEYVRGDAHTNAIEGYFSIFKRGMVGVYQHCSDKHLKRYLTEFEFRYNQRTALGVSNTERTVAALRGIEGKRLTCRRTAQG
ncbi:MAG TPA: IS1595 family transposase [Stellaceae bacterium]|nr:IS1595 family transposase [Stellaceae bacterium]